MLLVITGIHKCPWGVLNMATGNPPVFRPKAQASTLKATRRRCSSNRDTEAIDPRLGKLQMKGTTYHHSIALHLWISKFGRIAENNSYTNILHIWNGKYATYATYTAIRRNTFEMWWFQIFWETCDGPFMQTCCKQFPTFKWKSSGHPVIWTIRQEFVHEPKPSHGLA